MEPFSHEEGERRSPFLGPRELRYLVTEFLEQSYSTSSHPCTRRRHSMGIFCCDSSRAGACRAPRRLERVFSTGSAVVQDANNYGRGQLFPCGPPIPHTCIRVRWGVAGSTIVARGAGVCVLRCGLSLKGTGEWGEVLVSSGQHPREETLGCPEPPLPSPHKLFS